MNTRTISLVGALALTALGSTASAEPAWCKREGKTDFHRSAGPYLGDDPEKALESLVRETCAPDDDLYSAKHTPKITADLAAARATWSKRFGLAEADWADVVAWQGTSQRTRAVPWGSLDRKTAWTKLDALDQYASFLEIRESGHYLADALGARLTEAGRLGYLDHCLSSDRVGEWAMCQPDLAALDATRLHAEVRADKAHTGYQRMLVRLELYRSTKRIAARTAEVATLVAKDPGYAKLFALAATTGTAWAASPPDAKILDLVAAMDDARVTQSNAAFAGCDVTTYAALATAVSAVGAKHFAKIPDEPGKAFIYAGTDPLTITREGYLASTAFHLCHAQNPDVLVRQLGAELKYAPGFRGPRTAAQTATMSAEIKLDDRGAHIQFPAVNRGKDLYGSWFSGGGSMSGGGSGMVAAVKADGETVRIGFVKKLVKLEVCDDWQDTNKIAGFDTNNNIRYEKVCKKRKFETVNQASDPQTVNKQYATGVKVGVFVSTREAIVETVRAKPGAVPTYVFGAPVK